MSKKKKRSIFRRILKGIFFLFAFTLVLIAVALGVVYVKYSPTLNKYIAEAESIVEKSSKASFSSELGGRIYYSNGQIMSYLKSGKNLTYLRFDDIPQDVIDAFVAVEDKRFYDHDGIDRMGIARVIYHYVKSHGKQMAGASTITQQLSRNIFLTHEVSVQRKVKEVLIALSLEKKYSKKEILEFYINNIYFGNGFYGIGAAAKGYFDKDIKKLSLSQIAFLAAIPNNPSHYDPIEHKDRTLLRRDKFLRDMHEQGYITDKEFNKAIHEKIKLKQSKSILNDYETTYAIESAIRYLMYNQGFTEREYFNSKKDYNEYQESYQEVYGQCRQRLYVEGFDIYTSIDKKIQKSLQKKIDDTLSFSKEVKDNEVYSFQGAATLIDNTTGNVIAIVGGRNQRLGGLTFNRAFQAYRQPGSTIKPLVVYTPAIENGYVKNTIVEDKKMDDGPANSGGVYLGNISLQTAVEKSKNVVAWNLMEELTPRTGLSYVQEMSFRKIVPSDYVNAAALGGFTYGATTEEMAGAYATLANNGIFREPTCLVAIKKDGDELYSQKKEKNIYSRAASQEMTEILKGVLKRGTAAKLGWKNTNIEAAAKTGTTNESKDGWFCGYTPYYTLSVWVGYDSPRAVKGLWGASYPGYIWKAMMEELVADKPAAKFDTDFIGKEKNPTAISKYAMAHTPSRNVGGLDEQNANIVAGIINKLENLPGEENARADALYNKAMLTINSITDEELKAEYLNALNAAMDSYRSLSDDSVIVPDEYDTDSTTANPNNTVDTKSIEDKEPNNTDKPSENSETNENTENTVADIPKPTDNEQENVIIQDGVEIGENEQLLDPIN